VNTHMWTNLNSFVMGLVSRLQIQREEGQALVEYTLILALIAIVAIVALQLIGTNVLAALNSIAGKI
jgi:pilus assembly protein Flp/PilA